MPSAVTMKHLTPKETPEDVLPISHPDQFVPEVFHDEISVTSRILRIESPHNEQVSSSRYPRLPSACRM